jgi:hypothetical protein
MAGLLEQLVVMPVESVKAVPKVADWAAEQVKAHSSSGLVLASGMLVCRMLVATACGQAGLMMVPWVRPCLGAPACSGALRSWRVRATYVALSEQQAVSTHHHEVPRTQRRVPWNYRPRSR